MVAQLACTLLPLVDGWHGVGAGPHIEAAGRAPHYAHAEDMCTACHVGALTAHPAPTLRVAVDLDPTWRSAAIGPFAPADIPLSSATSSHRSRAPPTVN